MLTKVDVINKVVEHYGSDPKNRRSVTGEKNNLNQDVCRYNGPNGQMCAFAYFVKPEIRPSLMEGYSVSESMRLSSEKLGLSDILNDDVKHIVEPIFWIDVQILHDDCDNWDLISNSISENGKDLVQRLLKKYQN